MPDTDIDSDLAQLKKDLNHAANRAGKATYLEAKKEFSEQAYPLMQAVFDLLSERIGNLEDAVGELINQQDSFLQMDVATQILSTLDLGRALAEAQKESADPALRDLVARYIASADVSAAAILDITNDEAPPEDEDEDGEEDGEEEEDEEATVPERKHPPIAAQTVIDVSPEAKETP